mmetsp:Transcript_10408/g.36545  ORF Transcript_10408/g.36545 Transcript_10408/m.36545 type:complete len:275 (+) Transcript_10408:237-1061(+)
MHPLRGHTEPRGIGCRGACAGALVPWLNMSPWCNKAGSLCVNAEVLPPFQTSGLGCRDALEALWPYNTVPLRRHMAGRHASLGSRDALEALWPYNTVPLRRHMPGRHASLGCRDAFADRARSRHTQRLPERWRLMSVACGRRGEVGTATAQTTLLMHLGPCRHTYRSTGLDRALDCPMPLLVRARIDRRARASRRGAGPRGGTGKRSAQRTVGGRISWRMTCRNATGRTRSVHAHQPGIQFEGRRAACQRERGARIVPDWRRMRHLLLGAESPD